MTLTRRGFLFGTLLAPLLKFLPKPLTDFRNYTGRLYFSASPTSDFPPTLKARYFSRALDGEAERPARAILDVNGDYEVS